MSDRMPVHDAIAAALATFSGLSPQEHEHDARLITFIDDAQIDKPKLARERARRIRTAAVEIERAIAAMGSHEMSVLTGGIISSEHASRDRPIRQPLSRKAVLTFARALQDGAMGAERSIDRAISVHYTDHENADLRRNIVAMQVAEIYSGISGREPPRAGADEPFQRLLRAVYKALGHSSADLRAPLRAVHEFRKNRESCN